MSEDLDKFTLIALVLVLRRMPSLQLRVKRRGKWRLLKVSKITTQELMQFIDNSGNSLDEVISEITETLIRQSNLCLTD